MTHLLLEIVAFGRSIQKTVVEIQGFDRAQSIQGQQYTLSNKKIVAKLLSLKRHCDVKLKSRDTQKMKILEYSIESSY